MNATNGQTLKVGLFVTCLVDLFRPNIGFAAIKLLEAAGCNVQVPKTQTCCGQPAFNSGDNNTARRIACQVIDAFEKFDYVVAPSGSCAGMLKHHYRDLFAADDVYRDRAKSLAGRTHELLGFLVDELGFTPTGSAFHHKATYHDSCSGLRELGIKSQPRALLKNVEGLALEEMADTDVCCGFGGTFCVKYGEISTRLVSDKIANITSTGADVVLGGDLGCLLNIAGRLRRLGHDIEVFHTAEVLTGLVAPGSIAGPPSKKPPA